MIKLKNLIKEGFAWERKADGSLPTLKDAIATHRTNLAESEKSLSDLEYAVKQHEQDNHVYDKTKLTNIYNQLSDIDQQTAKTKFSKYFGSAKPRWQDSDGDGKWYEPEDVSEDLNELSDDEIDKRWNTPQQRWQRQFVTADLENNNKFKNKQQSATTTQPKEINRFYQEKLAALEAERQQLMFDMEQEAEPEGGPIADYYGGELEMLDKRIAAVRKRM
jgi:hypothetical protein